jgi:hypothetical protein
MQKRLLQTALWAGLLASLFFIFISMIFTAEALLAPWDYITSARPDSGTWQAAVNAFFERSPGNMLFAIPLVLIALRYAFRATRQSTARLAQILLGSLIFIAVNFSMLPVSRMINNLLFGAIPTGVGERYYEAIGYHRSVIPLLMLLILSTAWVIWQHRLTQSDNTMQSTRKQKRKNKQIHYDARAQTAAHRLQTPQTASAAATSSSNPQTRQSASG